MGVWAETPFRSEPKTPWRTNGHDRHPVYLGRYTDKLAISKCQIKQLDKVDRTVTFQMKNYKKGGQKELLKLSTQEFVRRFALHVLPRALHGYGITVF
ncbi:transposase [Arenibacter nanhaiticus]|uniref:transposase n=1 Tax=Arenibacter nanhaiticus TaxID=558155 RepID=UPI000933E8B4|nr:transposase [Arenibacter nanhaiticus]